MAPRIVVIANQKGGVGKTTVAVNLAAVTYDNLVSPGPVMLGMVEDMGDPTSPVMVVSTDPQQSLVWWSNRVEEHGGLPFDFDQVDDPTLLRKLRHLTDKRYVFIDTPGSLENKHILAAALHEADEVLVPMPPEPLAFEPTARTIATVIQPLGLPYRVVVNAWDPRDGDADLRDTAVYIRRMGWPACNTVVRRYKVHTKAGLDGRVVTQYPKNRAAMEAREDFFRLAGELGYGALPATNGPAVSDAR